MTGPGTHPTPVLPDVSHACSHRPSDRSPARPGPGPIFPLSQASPDTLLAVALRQSLADGAHGSSSHAASHRMMAPPRREMNAYRTLTPGLSSSRPVRLSTHRETGLPASQSAVPRPLSPIASRPADYHRWCFPLFLPGLGHLPVAAREGEKRFARGGSFEPPEEGGAGLGKGLS